MDLLDHASSSSYRLSCPEERYEKDKDGKVITISSEIHHIISSSYLVSSDAKGEKSNHLVSLLSRNEREKYSCRACRGKIIDKTYYLCNHCDGKYHKECVESPSVFHSSDHPKHPLQLFCYSKWSFYQRKCSSCRETFGRFFYYCSICDFIVDPICAKNPTSRTIDNRKRHEHTLHYFPRRPTLVCDVCGLEDDTDYLYVCILCDFLVHKRCVYLPYVIKTSRHDHRLNFVPNVPYKEWPDCGVCHAKINGNYGKYSCIKGCAYAMHSRCAMRSDVCDGKELEGEPEETYENIKMYEEEGDGIIRHLSHPRHQMRLKSNIYGVCDENKYCQACTLPFYNDGNVYQCIQCDFSLHESCVYIPRVKQSVLHVHPLILKTDYTENWFLCRKCYRYSCGFRYVCRIEGCVVELDTLCASVCEPFDYHSHPHPLFITYNENTYKECSICKFHMQQPLNCVKCDFVLCFHCAMLPYKSRYEHDEHLLIFAYRKDANDEVYWCEICEEDINPKKGLYACNECEVTLHIECLLGREPYMKPRQIQSGTISEEVHVLPNTCSSRPICQTCQRRCPYKIKIESSGKGVFCSYYCLQESTDMDMD